MPRRLIRLGLPVLIVGLAATLRFYNLTWNSFDNDEAFSWFVSQKPPGALIVDSFYLIGDPHPPVYWAALKAWSALAGDSEPALRWLSAAAGTVFVALTFELGRRLFSWPAGVIAALWAALSPYLIWNSQDARMYTLASTLALAGLVCLVNGLRLGGRRWWGGYFVLMTLACYTNIGVSFTLPFQGLVVMASVPALRRRGWAALITLAAISLAFTPFALNTWRLSGNDATPINRYTLTLPEILHTATVTIASYRAPLSLSWQWGIALFVGAVFLLGVVTGREAPSLPCLFGRGLAGLFYLAPLAVIVILSSRQPLFMPKLLVFVAGGLALGIGAGVSRLWGRGRWAGIAVSVGLIGIQGYGIGSIWQLGLQKEDWRNAANYVADHLGPNDVVIVHPPHYHIPFEYYFRKSVPVVTPFDNNPGDPDTIDQILSQYTNYDTIWLVQSADYLGDPEHRVQSRLAARYPLATELFPFSISVREFIVHPQLSSLPSSATAVGAIFGDSIRVAGYDLDAQRLRAREEWMHPPTNWIHLRLYGMRLGAPASEPAIIVTVEDEIGRVWGGNMDRVGETVDLFPPSAWPEKTIMRLDFDLNLNVEMPPGSYKIVVRLRRPDGSFLPVSISGAGTDYLILQRVEITP